MQDAIPSLEFIDLSLTGDHDTIHSLQYLQGGLLDLMSNQRCSIASWKLGLASRTLSCLPATKESSNKEPGFISNRIPDACHWKSEHKIIQNREKNRPPTVDDGLIRTSSKQPLQNLLYPKKFFARAPAMLCGMQYAHCFCNFLS